MSDLEQEQAHSFYYAQYLMHEQDAKIARLRETNAELLAALAWYEEKARLCRLIHSEGDAGRNALASDGGDRARTAILNAELLAALKECCLAFEYEAEVPENVRLRESKEQTYQQAQAAIYKAEGLHDE